MPSDYTSFLKADALKGKRIGLLRQAMGWHPAVDAALDRAVATLKAQSTIRDVPALKTNADALMELIAFDSMRPHRLMNTGEVPAVAVVAVVHP